MGHHRRSSCMLFLLFHIFLLPFLYIFNANIPARLGDTWLFFNIAIFDRPRKASRRYYQQKNMKQKK